MNGQCEMCMGYGWTSRSGKVEWPCPTCRPEERKAFDAGMARALAAAANGGETIAQALGAPDSESPVDAARRVTAERDAALAILTEAKRLAVVWSDTDARVSALEERHRQTIAAAAKARLELTAEAYRDAISAKAEAGRQWSDAVNARDHAFSSLLKLLRSA